MQCSYKRRKNEEGEEKKEDEGCQEKEKEEAFDQGADD
jgi:hypothetical protein